MSWSKLLEIVIGVGLITGFCGSAHATFTPLTLPDLNLDLRTFTDGSTYDPLFPGAPTWNGVPFTLAVDGEGHMAWWKAEAVSASLDIPVNLFGATSAYTIVNSAWGVLDATAGSVEFFGSGGSYYSVALVEGTNLRDHYDGHFNNVIDGVHAVPVFNVGPRHARLDMQIYTLPASFAAETLTAVRFTSAGSHPDGVPFLVAATVQTPAGEVTPPASPAPGAMLLVALGAGAVDTLRRRRVF